MAQLSAVGMALAIAVGSGSYGTTRGFLSDSLPPAWAGGEAIRAPLADIRADPCNRPDTSTVEVKLTTLEPGEPVGRRPGIPVQQATPESERKVWLVELKSDGIASLGFHGPRPECPEAPGGTLIYTVSLDGKVISASSAYNWGSEP
jgi:hypothetical protein